ncbi:MAG: DUF3119 family protein [Cyanobacteria bacterium P01_A01_bin.123]
MTTTSNPGTTELSPSYRLSLAIIGVSLIGLLVSPWLSLGLSLLGLFLFAQTLAIRLRFTSTALEVFWGDRRLRQFPYEDWQHWEIFWTPIPILFYFREVKSIHFLPVLFDPQQLYNALDQYCPKPQLSQPPTE